MDYVGIDPGLQGAVAVLWGNGDLYLVDLPHRSNVLDARAWLGHSLLLPERGRVVVEQQWSKGRGARTIYQNYGRLLACLEAAGHEVAEVTAAVWKRWYGLSSDKVASLEAAADLFGDFAVGITHDQAEALLLANYGKEKVWRE